MLHRVAALFQLFLLAFNQARILQLLILELQEILILTIALYTLSEGIKFVFRRQILLIGLLVSFELIGVARYDINHIQLEILLVKQQILVLGMDINQLVTEFL